VVRAKRIRRDKENIKLFFYVRGKGIKKGGKTKPRTFGRKKKHFSKKKFSLGHFLTLPQIKKARKVKSLYFNDFVSAFFLASVAIETQSNETT